MRYSVGLPVDHVTMADEFVTGAAIAEMAAAVEAAGLDAVFVTDHPAPDDRWLAGGGHHAQEPMVALAFAAAATRRVMLHTHVYIAAYRNPFLAAKGVATLQNLSGGRVLLGVAAGYLRPEFAALGVEFDARNDLLAETVHLLRRAWTEDGVAVETERFTARGVTQLPHPAPVPIWIGGNSTRAMRHAVELGDGWSPFPNPPAAARAVKTPAITKIEDLAARLDAARAHADEIGRTDPLTICFAPFAASDDHAVYAELGVDWLTVGFHGCTSRAEWLDRLGEFAARVV
jgi:probable F420-dependent oxidoreductase